MSDFDAIRTLVTQYFDGLYTGDTATLARVFHERSRLHAILDGKLAELALSAYMDLVQGRPSPKSLGAARSDHIIAIQHTTATTAIVTVSLLLAGKSFTDHLSLIKDEGRWQIISKVYHLNQPT